MFKLRIKLFALIFCIIFAAVGAGSCSSGSPAADTSGTSGKLSIVCTVFPAYDWVKQILGSSAEGAEITYLLGNGADMHNYQPSADDIIRISGCDLFIYVGGESDEWAESALENAVNKNIRSVSLLEAIGSDAKTEEIKEGMQAEEEEEADGEEEEEYDEHVWLSVRNAKKLCECIADEICAADPKNADAYRSNLRAYSDRLDALDKSIADVVSASGNKTLIFCDRFPFRYFTDDYGLDYYAAFVGCSAETEASFETVVFLAEKVKELGCGTVYTIENSDKSIAETVISGSGVDGTEISKLNSMQSVSRSEADGGTTYISIMEQNRAVLEQTLK